MNVWGYSLLILLLLLTNVHIMFVTHNQRLITDNQNDIMKMIDRRLKRK